MSDLTERLRRGGTIHSDGDNATMAEAADRIEALEGALALYRSAVRIDVLMEGTRFGGSNVSALKKAWEHDRRTIGDTP